MTKTKKICDYFDKNIKKDKEYKLLELKKILLISYNKYINNDNNKLVHEKYLIKKNI